MTSGGDSGDRALGSLAHGQHSAGRVKPGSERGVGEGKRLSARVVEGSLLSM